MTRRVRVCETNISLFLTRFDTIPLLLNHSPSLATSAIHGISIYSPAAEGEQRWKSWHYFNESWHEEEEKSLYRVKKEQFPLECANFGKKGGSQSEEQSTHR